MLPVGDEREDLAQEFCLLCCSGRLHFDPARGWHWRVYACMRVRAMVQGWRRRSEVRSRGRVYFWGDGFDEMLERVPSRVCVWAKLAAGRLAPPVKCA